MSKLLLATDLDKTLLDDRAEVPGVCLDAIRASGLIIVLTFRPALAVEEKCFLFQLEKHRLFVR